MAHPLDRAELGRLGRDTLIARAEGAGVSRANILTRPELVDELLLRSAKKGDPRVSHARGFFGRARDLLSRVIERGLHLPDAVERLRRAGSIPPPPSRASTPAVPTVTLAEIYAAQGHNGRAVETLKRVLDHEPEHAAARSLLTRLSEGDGSNDTASTTLRPGEAKAEPEPDEALPIASDPSTSAEPPLSGVEPQEPFGFLDDDPLPRCYGVDECVAIPIDPTTIFAYWEIRVATLTHLRRQRSKGVVALRAFIIMADWDGPRSFTRDIDVGEPIGEWVIRDLPAGAVVRVAMGWRTGDVFLPVGHSPALETPYSGPGPMPAEVAVRWTREGMVPVSPSDSDFGVIERAVDRMRASSASHPGDGRGVRAEALGVQGSSEHAHV
jgi:Domain of unknown function (DUF4912)